MTTLTLTAFPAGTPAPYVDVLAESFPVGTATVTVWRTAGGRAFKVRGLVRVSASGTVTARDFEAPFDVVSTYRVEHFDGSGIFTTWSSYSPVTLTGTGVAWFHNPLDPSTAMSVTMLDSAGRVLSRPVDAEVLRVRGRSVGIALFGTREGLTKLVLDCFTVTDAATAQFDSMFGDYDDDETVPILCVRAPADMLLPPTLFALVFDPVRTALAPEWGDHVSQWTLTGDEISPPAEAIVVSLLGYDDFTAFYADYAAFTAAYVDYRAAQRDYTIAGTV